MDEPPKVSMKGLSRDVKQAVKNIGLEDEVIVGEPMTVTDFFEMMNKAHEYYAQKSDKEKE